MRNWYCTISGSVKNVAISRVESIYLRESIVNLLIFNINVGYRLKHFPLVYEWYHFFQLAFLEKTSVLNLSVYILRDQYLFRYFMRFFFYIQANTEIFLTQMRNFKLYVGFDTSRLNIRVLNFKYVIHMSHLFNNIIFLWELSMLPKPCVFISYISNICI